MPRRMQRRPRRFNPKRAIRSAADPAWLARIAVQVVYTGSPIPQIESGGLQSHASGSATPPTPPCVTNQESSPERKPWSC